MSTAVSRLLRIKCWRFVLHHVKCALHFNSQLPEGDQGAFLASLLLEISRAAAGGEKKESNDRLADRYLYL